MTSPDRLAAELAASQHGVVSRAQLEALGVNRHMVRHRVATGHMRIVHPKVLAIGLSRLSPPAQRLAASLATEPHGAVARRSAGQHWGFVRGAGPVHVVSTRHIASGHGLVAPPDRLAHSGRPLHE